MSERYKTRQRETEWEGGGERTSERDSYRRDSDAEREKLDNECVCVCVNE